MTVSIRPNTFVDEGETGRSQSFLTSFGLEQFFVCLRAFRPRELEHLQLEVQYLQCQLLSSKCPNQPLYSQLELRRYQRHREAQRLRTNFGSPEHQPIPYLGKKASVNKH